VPHSGGFYDLLVESTDEDVES